MAEDSTDFDTWLSEYLQKLKTDEAVFGPYIKSILEGDEDFEEKVEGLDGILVELGGNIDVEALRNEILSKWNMGKENGTDQAASSISSGSSAALSKTDGSSIDQQLFDRLLTLTNDVSASSNQASSSATNMSKELNNPPDAALRAAILSQYRTSDSESGGEEDPTKTTKKKSANDDDLCKNVNSERFLTEQRESKEKAKEEAAKKRERDKEDRAKQKQAVLDRKEKAKKKATKVERKSGR